jgi:hypothetical protein
MGEIWLRGATSTCTHCLVFIVVLVTLVDVESFDEIFTTIILMYYENN